jgi:endonuclease/exonuclease/phosphatase family metal-dependent hydrolase
MHKYLVGLILAMLLPFPAHAAEQPFTVATRNLYLGADVGVALELIPDFSAAAQFMWNQVSATDFSKRAPVLAQEIIASGADVVGLQEATHWYCKKNLWSKKVVVFDFTREFLDATKAAGSEYVLATHKGVDAMNIGYSIPAIPYLTMVEDPSTFQPLFGSDKAACGFEIGDALVVKKSLASKIVQVGNTEYESSYSIVPTLMTIYRGYTWADINYNGSIVRVVTTHLESLWDSGKVPHAALQAQQLVADLKKTSMPVIVMGDFNADPRDPRKDAAHNPGGQPEASAACPIGSKACNAYWIMTGAGFHDVGPNALDPRNHTWGMSALLAGPDLTRYKAALKEGNTFGFTDRLDYIFVSPGVKAQSSKTIGNTWPNGSTWNCTNEEQISQAQQISNAMKVDLPSSRFCSATDHAGVVAKIVLPANTLVSPALDAHQPFPISFWNWVGIVLLLVIAYFIKRALSRRVVK